MVRRRKSEPTTQNARDLALAIRQGERAKLSQREIAATLGIDPRTVRKIKSGQTSGTRTFRRITRVPSKPRAETGLFNAEFIVGYTASGEPVYGSTNMTIARIRTRTGEYRAPTPLDVFRVRQIAAVIAAERAALTRRYSNVTRVASDDSAVRLRAISTARKRTHVIRLDSA